MSSSVLDPLDSVLQRVWGYPEFRPLQRPIAESVLSGRDTVALLPTGGGKSLCFQVPGLVLGGTCIVVSPLISLMADQVHQLVRRGIDARSLAGDLRPADWVKLQRQPPQFAYVSPERAQSKNFLAMVEHWDVRLLAIDEAHCVSQWGHDFRPQYVQLKTLRSALSGVPCIALTASATPEVLDDMVQLLGLVNPFIAQGSFARPNLIWTVREVPDVVQACCDAIQPDLGRQIVYVRSRAGATKWAELLKQKRIPAAAYHAGLPREERMKLQEAWSEGEIRTMVATTAFGMGIDQPDVRQVVHVEVPESPESLYQEMGRGGRDGGDAQALVLVDPKSLAQFRRKMERSVPEFDVWRSAYHALASRAQIAVGDGTGVPVRPQKAEEDFVLQVLVRKGLAERIEAQENSLSVQLRYGGTALVDAAEANPAFSELLYALARRYPGIVHHAERVDLPSFAASGGWTITEVRSLVASAAHLGLLEAVLDGSGSTYRWGHPRYPQGTSPIPKSEWDRDRSRILRRARAVAQVVDPDSKTCRFTQLLAYFGEEAKDCGRCDVCAQKKPAAGGVERMRSLLSANPDKRMQVAQAALLLPVPRAEFLNILQQGAALGWWTVDAEGWLRL